MFLLRVSSITPIAFLPQKAGPSRYGCKYPKHHKSKKRREILKKNRRREGFRNLNKAFREAAEIRGDNNECFVGETLFDLKNQGLIKEYRKTERDSSEDREGGIDFVVTKNSGSQIGIQVKSSNYAARRFENIQEFLGGKNSLNIRVHVVIVRTKYLRFPNLLMEEIKKILR